MCENIIKSISVFFVNLIVISIQSCKVYNQDAVPELEAVATAKKVKVTTTGGIIYKFEKLVLEEEKLVGLSKSKSKAAKYLPSEKYVDSMGRSREKVLIDRETIKEINVYNKKKSKNRSIWLGAGLTLGVIAAGIGVLALSLSGM